MSVTEETPTREELHEYIGYIERGLGAHEARATVWPEPDLPKPGHQRCRHCGQDIFLAAGRWISQVSTTPICQMDASKPNGWNHDPVPCDGWVCEDHPNRAWPDPITNACGVGMPCPCKAAFADA